MTRNAAATGTVSPALRVQVEGIRVTHPRWQRIVAEIERCQEWGPVAAEPPCLLVGHATNKAGMIHRLNRRDRVSGKAASIAA